MNLSEAFAEEAHDLPELVRLSGHLCAEHGQLLLRLSTALRHLHLAPLELVSPSCELCLETPDLTTTPIGGAAATGGPRRRRGQRRSW